MTLGVDVGGTFTDLAWWDGARLRVGKTPTSRHQDEAVVSGALRLLESASVPALLHGTTVATNALLERAGARTALVVEEGFEDLVEIGRQERPSLYDPFADRPEPLVPGGRRFGCDPDLDPAGLVARVGAVRPAAVAVSFLYSFRDPSAERRIGAALAEAFPGLPLCLSGEVAPEFREFERISTTVLNAYL
ncbi:MAG: hydantoinase/oxoprolinase N-terminal domain-containing protein, partial [Acidimicrobiia bacterium]